MARLEFTIDGNNSGLANAANQSIGILESLQGVADKLKIDLFKAGTVEDINLIGAALTRVTGQITDYINTAVKSSQAFQDQSAAAALDTLSTKLLTVTGNAELFGQSIKNQQNELNAYQSALNALLGAGVDPLDSRVTDLKGKIDTLTQSISTQKSELAASTAAINAEKAAMDTLATSLQVANGLTQVFGQSILTQQSQVNAYNTAIKQLLAAGVGPLDSRITSLKSKIDVLTSSIAGQKQEIAGESAGLQTVGNTFDALNAKLVVTSGNTVLFGNTVGNQRTVLAAYQTAINQLLAAGLSPLDAKVQTLKGHVNELTASIANQSKAASTSSFGTLGSQATGLIGTYASLYGAIRLVGDVIKTNADISDSLSNVRRVTGLTTGEVNDLNEALKKISTRTSLNDLLGITVIGGQLGIANDQLVGFTASVNRLSVALKGELEGGAQGVAKDLGVISNIFKITQSNGGDVEKSFNQIGSAILGLGQSGLATGQYLSDFAGRVGGVAAQFKLSLPLILSYGAVLQEQGVTAEVAGTAFKKLIGSLGSKSEKFFAVAQIADASLTLKDFTNLINNDAQKALELFFKGLNQGGATNTEFATLLKSLGLDAARSGNAIAVLSRNQQELQQHLKDSTKDFNDGTLAAKQAAIQEDNLAGSVAKLSNAFDKAVQGDGVGRFFKSIVDGATRALEATDKLLQAANKGNLGEVFSRLTRPGGNAKFDIADTAFDSFTASQKADSKVRSQLPAPTYDQRVSGTLPGLGNLDENKLQGFLANYRKAYSEAYHAYSVYFDAIKNGIIASSDKNLQTLEGFKKNAQSIDSYASQVQAAYDKVKKSSTTKQETNDVKELTDAQLKSIPAIRQRLKELTNLPDSGVLGSETNQRIIALRDRLRELAGAAGRASTVAQDQLSLSTQLKDILEKGNTSAGASGLGGYASEVQKITTSYQALNAKLDEFDAKVKIQRSRNIASGGRSGITGAEVTDLTSQSTAGRTALAAGEAKQLADARIAEAARTANEIQRINNEFGVKAQQTRAKELAQIQATADAEIAKASEKVLTIAQIEEQYNSAVAAAKGNQGKIDAAKTLHDVEIQQAQDSAIKIQAIREGLAAATQTINDKYERQSAELYAKIADIESLAVATATGQEESKTQQIVNEWEKRRRAAEEYYRQLQVLNAGTGTGSAVPNVADGLKGINAARIANAAGNTNAAITAGENVAVAKKAGEDLSRELTRGIQSFGQTFLQTFTEFNQLADHSFGTIFSTLTSKLTSSLNSIFLDVITKGLSKKLSDAISSGTSGLSPALQGAAAAAGIAGGIISGVTPKTSSVGQGLGGALSGAATGAVIGSVIPGLGTVAGGVVGGVVGLAGGLFGSKKARKQQEELQQQQLDEARKQTALLRQQALAYTSSIIGKQTVNGVITGVDINSFGELTARVSGSDLQFVLDRNNAKR